MGIEVKKVLVIVVSMVKVREFFGTSATNNVAIWGEATHGIEPTAMSPIEEVRQLRRK